MPRDGRTAIFVRCTPEQSQRIRQAAKAERRTLSDFVLNAVFKEAPREAHEEDLFDEEMSREWAQSRNEVRSLVMEGEDLETSLRLAHEHHKAYVTESLARARARLARAQSRLLRRRDKFPTKRPPPT